MTALCPNFSSIDFIHGYLSGNVMGTIRALISPIPTQIHLKFALGVGDYPEPIGYREKEGFL